MRNVNSLPNGRLVVACLNCGYKMDLSKYGWTKAVCPGCRAIIQNPINERLKEEETKKTNLMLSVTDRQYIQTISTLQGVTKSKALSQILEYSRQEYRAAGGVLLALEEEDSLETTKKAVKGIFKGKKANK